MLQVLIGVCVLFGGLVAQAQSPFDVPILDTPTLYEPPEPPPTLPTTLPRTPAAVVPVPQITPAPPTATIPVPVSVPDHPLAGLVGAPRTADTLISGAPLPLVAVLQSTRQPARRLQRIIAYWDCTEALAEYHLRCAFERQLETWSESLRQSSGVVGGSVSGGDATTMLAILSPAMRLATSERRAAEIRFVRQQRHLADGIDATDSLPIPCELPLVKAYDTKIDALAQQRAVSPRARELAAQIPMQHLLIGYHREGAVAAEEVFRAVYEHRASLMESILALRQVVSVRQELVASICSYNKMIAEYVNETIGGEADTHRLLLALIELTPQSE